MSSILFIVQCLSTQITAVDTQRRSRRSRRSRRFRRVRRSPRAPLAARAAHQLRPVHVHLLGLPAKSSICLGQDIYRPRPTCRIAILCAASKL